MKKFFVFLALLALPATPVMAQATISAGRAIEIQIKGVPADEMARVNGTYTVSENGMISMPLLNGSIRAAGLSPTSLARSIEAAYRAGEIYTSPTINVIATNQEQLQELTVTVGGQVNGAGPVKYYQGLTIYDAVQAARGPTAFGAMKRVNLVRGSQSKEYNLTDPKHMNIRLEPGDKVIVPQKNWRGG
jgi:polysaccharide export outer membrane protein